MMHSNTEEIEIKLLLEAIFLRYQYDFRSYAQASLRRRLEQFKTRQGYETYSELQDLILHDEDSFRSMLSYLTIQVSEMFRDPEYFRDIRLQVVPHLKTYPSIRVWVAGCSAGEELYSLAILFREEGLETKTIFYGTDINTEALDRARQGIYPLDRVALYSQNYRRAGGRNSLSDYFTAAYENVKFDATLRNNMVLSDHSLVSDSVFAEMHLISCRNVLIYFNRDLQNQCLRLFKSSLTRRGFLGLGNKETLRFTDVADEFDEFTKGTKIYQLKAVLP